MPPSFPCIRTETCSKQPSRWTKATFPTSYHRQQQRRIPDWGDTWFQACPKTLKYIVRWVAYDELNWEPAELLKNSPELVDYFHRKYPTKPKPDYLLQLRPDPGYSHPEPAMTLLSSLSRRTNLRFRRSSPLKRGLLSWTLPCQYVNPWCYYS